MPVTRHPLRPCRRSPRKGRRISHIVFEFLIRARGTGNGNEPPHDAVPRRWQKCGYPVILVLDSALWGLVQGLTEFLPISSSGHLVLIPAFLDKEAPDLATTAVLHLGTLAAVLWYFRQDVAWLVRPDRDPRAWQIVKLLALGTVPAVVAGLLLESTLDDLFDSPTRVGLALIFTGIVLLASGTFHRLTRTPRRGRGARCRHRGRAPRRSLSCPGSPARA